MNLKREIYQVEAKAVDASGSYNNLSGYPTFFDSHTNGDDCDKAYNKACASYASAESAGYTAANSGRPLTIVTLIRVSDGLQLKKAAIGKIPDIVVPDPTYNVTVENGTGSGAYAVGASVTIAADAPAAGKVFDKWTRTDNLSFISGSASTANASFRMPAEAVTLTATYIDAE